MPDVQLEERVALLESEVLELKRHLSAATESARPWWEQIMGTFADTPAFDEAVQLGRQFRDSQAEPVAEMMDDDVSA